jgi:hypothetical protein
LNVINRAIAGRPISVGGWFTAALHAQERIGWCSMLQGYWAEEWQSAYCQTYATSEEETPADKTKCRTTMDRWQARLIQTTWTGMIALWKIHINERHGCDKETQELARHKVLKNGLQIIYINVEQNLPAVQNLLRSSFEDHCGNKSYQIKDWLSTYHMTFQVMQVQPDG